MEHTDGEMGKFEKTHCPASRTMPPGKRLHDSHLCSVFYQHKAALTVKTASMVIKIILDKSTDVTGKLTVNVLSA